MTTQSITSPLAQEFHTILWNIEQSKILTDQSAARLLHLAAQMCFAGDNSGICRIWDTAISLREYRLPQRLRILLGGALPKSDGKGGRKWVLAPENCLIERVRPAGRLNAKGDGMRPDPKDRVILRGADVRGSKSKIESVRRAYEAHWASAKLADIKAVAPEKAVKEWEIADITEFISKLRTGNYRVDDGSKDEIKLVLAALNQWQAGLEARAYARAEQAKLATPESRAAVRAEAKAAKLAAKAAEKAATKPAKQAKLAA